MDYVTEKLSDYVEGMDPNTFHPKKTPVPWETYWEKADTEDTFVSMMAIVHYAEFHRIAGAVLNRLHRRPKGKPMDGEESYERVEDSTMKDRLGILSKFAPHLHKMVMIVVNSLEVDLDKI